MKRLVIFGLLLSCGVLFAEETATRKTKGGVVVSKVETGAATITVSIVPLPDGAPVQSIGSDRGILELGPVSAFGAARSGVGVRRLQNSLVISTDIAVRISSTGGEPNRSASVSGALTFVHPQQIFRLAGQTLSLTPVVVDRQAAVGVLRRYTLEIEIPYTLSGPDAVVSTSLGLLVLPD